MKKLLLLLFLSTSFLCIGQEYKKMISKGTYTLVQIQEAANKYFSINGTGRGTGYKQYKRWEYNARRLQSSDGMIRSNHFFAKEFEKYNAEVNSQRKQLQNAAGLWETLGPTDWTATTGYNPGVGRITSLAIDPNDSNKMIVGSPTGGVWKTIDKGTNWTPLSDQFSTMNVYSLTIDPTNSNTFFWGSNGGNIYKSTDAGSTWTAIGYLSFGNVNKILINPNNTQLMYATGEDDGIYKSIDGGANWTKVNTNFAGYDVEFKPGDFNTIYAAGTAFHKSTDGGVNWTTTTSGFDTGAKMIGVSANNPSTVYLLEEKGGLFGAFYVSTDSGATFTKKTHTLNYFGYATDGSSNLGQAPRDMAIAVSPTNANEIHIGGINTWRSLDGGTTFSPTSHWVPDTANNENIGYCHADVDDLIYNGSELFVVSDGGIFNSTNPGGAISATYYNDLTTGMGIHQFYKIGISQSNPVIITGGSQDNGTSVYSNGTWKNWWGADGADGFVDKDINTIIYGSSQHGGIVKSIDGGNTLDNITEPAPSNKSNFAFIAPFKRDPTASNTMYIGGKKMFKSTDGGIVWSEISQEFVAGSFVNEFATAPSDSNVIYAITDTGQLFKTTTGSGNWVELMGFNGFVNYVAVHPTDPNKVAIATSGNELVYISTDGGTNWNVSNTGLPNLASLCLTWQNNGKDGLYLGMNYGVYYIDNTFNSWQPFSNLLPNVIVNELEINTVDEKLYIATYGRGIWRTPLFDSAALSVNNSAVLDKINVFPNPTVSSINIKWDQSEKVELKLFNVKGQLLHLKKDTSISDYIIDVSNLSKGIYFLRVNSTKGIYTKKVIIK